MRVIDPLGRVWACLENPSRFYCCCKTGVQPKSLGGGGCCNLHKKTFWTTQEAVGTALDSSFATECIQHSKCIQAARVLERQTAKTRCFDASSRWKKSKNSALKKQLVYYCQVGSWASMGALTRIFRISHFPTLAVGTSDELLGGCSLSV